MKAPTLATRSGGRKVRRVLSARPDPVDFRDRMFEPTLVEVPTHIPLADYRAHAVPILDQGQEGACTGFALATVANYLLARRQVVPDRAPVSPRMLYEMARRYDEWPGEDYEWSSARGAMKGWHKHGICSDAEWAYRVGGRDPGGLTDARIQDALRRPLGAYLRVNHRDLVALHSALAEVGILYASADVHAGWDAVDAEGRIAWPFPTDGGHAFAVVAYDAEGFWLQNSWGPGWGLGGFARIGYDDWLANATDCWVARLGAPVLLRSHASAATAHAPTAGRSSSYSYAELRPHVVSLGNDGRLKARGDYATSPGDLQELFGRDLPRTVADWPVKHVLLYAHGGLVDERSAIQRLADYRATMLDQHIYPVSFVWHSDYWSTLTNILEDALRRRQPEGAVTSARDFLLDRVDDTLELLARGLTGKASWDEMKENALAACGPGGGALLALEQLAQLAGRMDLRLHVAGHSAGAIFQAPLVRLLTAPAGRIASGWLQGRTGFGLPVQTCTLWAPAATTALFKQAYLPAVQDGTIGRLALFALTDKAEQDDHVGRIYNKSLLYLVSRAFEERAFGPGTPLAGMEKGLAGDAELTALFTGGAADLVFSPNSEPEGSIRASRSAAHGAFDDDAATVRALVRRILESGGAAPVPTARVPLQFHAGAGTLRRRRRELSVGGSRP